MLKLFQRPIKNPRYFPPFIGLILFALSCERGNSSAFHLQFSYGWGKPDQLKGYRVALQPFWPSLELVNGPIINLRGYLDISFSRWQVKPVQINQPHSINILAVSPLLQLTKRGSIPIQPYLELGIGPSWLSKNHLGHRNLGGQFAFQDLIGLGLHLGKTQRLSLSYHYLHYSNASLLPPNEGIDIKHLLSLGYEF